MTLNLPYLSIVIPVYNEEDNIEILYREIRDCVDKLEMAYEIIFVNDGSSDNTIEILKAVKASERQEMDCLARTRIVNFSRNFGQTAAMQAGFDQAAGEIIITMDGDLQNDPADIPKLIDRLNQGYDVVSGWRWDRQDKTFTRVIPSMVANWMIGKITGVPIHDNGCSLKAYRSFVVKSVRIYSDMHRFISAMTTLVGARVSEIKVNHRPRKFGQAKYGLSRIWKVLFDIVTIKMLIHFYNRPIFWFGGLSIIFLVLGLLFAIISFYFFMNGESMMIYGTASILFFTLFGGILSWGLLAEFFVKIESSPSFANDISDGSDGNT